MGLSHGNPGSHCINKEDIRKKEIIKTTIAIIIFLMFNLNIFVMWVYGTLSYLKLSMTLNKFFRFCKLQ